MVCQTHIKTLLDGGVYFISRLPANFGKKLEARTIRRACDAPDAWQPLGRIGSGKKAVPIRVIGKVSMPRTFGRFRNLSKEYSCNTPF
jgi:hypothetical protein